MFYEKRLEAYISLYDQKIKELANFTAAISADSKKHTSGLWIGAEGLKENYFQYYMVTKEMLEKYTRYDVSDWGIYLYDLEKIIQPGITISFESFIDRYASIEEDKAKLEEFLSVNNYANTKIIYNTTNFSENYDGNLLMGICTRIGENNDSALAYFLLSPTDIEDSLAVMENALYIAYKPVHELTTELDYSGGGEFELIRNVLYDRHSRIEEQEMLIMDLLLNHLIYGVPISEKRMKRLGVTDWQGEERSVLILFTKDSDITAVRECLSRWQEESFISECAMYIGKVVDKLDDIQLSLRSCFDQIKKKNVKEQKEKDDINTQKQKEEQQIKMKEDILNYLELNYRDVNLSQVQVADHFRISNYTLSRLFKNQVGVGFAEYLVSKRLECAKELLLTTAYSVQEISAMAGFSSVNYFSRTFKIYVGVPPSAFRAEEMEQC